MKISLDWLRDYVDLPVELDINRVMYDLTMKTVEVENVIKPAERFKHVKVGRVKTIQMLSDSDASIICDTGSQIGLIKIESEIRNLYEGMLLPISVPFARAHANDNRVLENLHGVASEGLKDEFMVCTARDLELEHLFPTSNPEWVIDLSQFQPFPGDDFGTMIGWNDIVLEIDNKSLTNRPDLWGHYGIAREISAIYNCKLKRLPSRTQIPAIGNLVKVADNADCRRFTATLISDVRIVDAPFWIRSRLARLDQRPVNLLVDLTNYVMLSVGQPCHVFDASRLALPLEVRRAAQGENIQLLNGSEYSLDRSAVVVADQSGPAALAGIMGGSRTGLSDTTCEILLEIATFDPGTVRRTSTRLSLRSEASVRFDKNIDAQRVDDALNLFMSLLKTCQPSAHVIAHQDFYPAPPKTNKISISVATLLDRLGKSLSVDEITRPLSDIGFNVEIEEGNLHILVPTWRSTGDVSLPEDIVEEVARLHGYERFEFVAPQIRLVKKAQSRQGSFERNIREFLAFTGGMTEVITYPWIEDRFLAAASMEDLSTIRLSAPPAPDESQLRPSLVPNLLKCVRNNLRYYNSFRIFEVGRVFAMTNFRSIDNGTELLPSQTRHVAGALVGSRPEPLFREGRGLIEALRRAVHIKSLEFSNESFSSWAEPSARLGLESDGVHVGSIGLLANRSRRLADIKRAEIVLFEIAIDRLEAFPTRENRFVRLSEFPESDFDLSLIFSERVEWKEIAKEACGAHPLIRKIDFIDQFRGKDIPAGNKSITLRVHVGSSERTLTVTDIKDAATAVADVLAHKLNGRPRA